MDDANKGPFSKYLLTETPHSLGRILGYYIYTIKKLGPVTFKRLTSSFSENKRNKDYNIIYYFNLEEESKM